jgi:Acyclic terpene utilisation family protein AtuA
MTTPRPVRIANCSGFYGDRPSAAREMIDGGPIDVLTGDYLAELTMLILWKARQKDPTAGYATTFLTQMEDVLGSCLDRGIKVVSNAGGLNPGGLAGKLGQLAARLGRTARIAYVDGDDLSGGITGLLAAGHPLANVDTGQSLEDAQVEPVTANAYLGGWGIAAALADGADVVVCGRVTDASLVVGPAAWWHGWEPTEFDALAGAVAAGHIIECGPQATGGNYAWLAEIADRRYPGFPIAEVAADGSSVITKHPDTGGLVTTDTVTAQLLYEIAGPQYLNPDVVAHFDTMRLAQVGSDRVAVDGTRGSPPPSTLKVGINYLGGYRNTMTMVITGLDIAAKAAWAEQELFELLGGRERFDEVDVRLLRYDRADAPTNEQATAHLRITVKAHDPQRVGRAFSNATIGLALGGFAGFHTTTPPTAESEFGVYWPTLVPADLITHRVTTSDGQSRVVARPPSVDGAIRRVTTPPTAPTADGPTVRVPLGRIAATRSGDKGGNANVGVWVKNPAAYDWLRAYLGVERLRELIPEAADLEVERYDLANLRALNFVIVGLLGEGVAASTRPDPQAKGLGEYLRSRFVELPVHLLAGS